MALKMNELIWKNNAITTERTCQWIILIETRMLYVGKKTIPSWAKLIRSSRKNWNIS